MEFNTLDFTNEGKFIKEGFIGGSFIDEEICDALIEFHKETPEGRIEDSINPSTGYFQRGMAKTAGTVATEKGIIVDKNIKDSMDLDCGIWSKDSRVIAYRKALLRIIGEYRKEFPRCKACQPWGLHPLASLQIQHYKPGGGYVDWHTEYNGPSGEDGARHLVFMTYLNTVEDGGETGWYHQKIKIKPKKGLTVVWPVDWTYTHRGFIAPSEDKYITTGWFEYTNSNAEAPTKQEEERPSEAQAIVKTAVADLVRQISQNEQTSN
jgi:hypothetical protein